MKASSLVTFFLYLSGLSRAATISSFSPSASASTSAEQNATASAGSVSTYAASTLASSSSNTITSNQNPTLTSSSLSIDTTSSTASSMSNSASVTASSAPLPSSTPIDPATAQDIEVLTQRRLSNIVGALGSPNSISSWLQTLNATGQWPDVDYTTGCPAQRANWPAEGHWNRIATMTGAWHGGLAGADEYVKDPNLRAAISLAMDYWFSNDFTNPACLDSGGTATCPCGTPGLWNTNWFPGIIGIPELVAKSCLLLNDTLSDAELGSCITMTARAYRAFVVPAHQVGVLTGANLLDVAKIGIDLALLTTNVSLLTDAYARVHAELVIKNGVRADGIRSDGSFGQHTGILYNGNYGSDDVLDLEVEAGGTQFQATPASQAAFATLFNGDLWMIYKNVVTNVMHWDFSVLGRFIAFPTTDGFQPTGPINMNLTKLGLLGQEWNSTDLMNVASRLSENATSANAGSLVGNKMFYNNDYMVHRGMNYVTTLKMYSTRSVNTECTNLANPFGYHLSDGALHTYQRGDKYEDIAAAMDWNLIPGITVDYGATPLTCARTGSVGIENFVGGVSDGQLGAAAMRYTNSLTKSLHFQKAWFFLDDDVQLVMISNITSTNASAPVLSVLDQKRRSGPVIMDTDLVAPSQQGMSTQTLWHDNVGYSFAFSPANAFSLSVEVGKKTGDWGVIGTSSAGIETVDLFAAWITHEALNASLAYAIFPDTDYDTFSDKSSESEVLVVQNDASISAALDPGSATAMAVFWAAGGGTVAFRPSSPAAFTMSTNGTAAVMYNLGSRVLTVSDPTQTLSAISVTLSMGASGRLIQKTVVFTLPRGGLAGSSVSQKV